MARASARRPTPRRATSGGDHEARVRRPGSTAGARRARRPPRIPRRAARPEDRAPRQDDARLVRVVADEHRQRDAEKLLPESRHVRLERRRRPRGEDAHRDPLVRAAQGGRDDRRERPRGCRRRQPLPASTSSGGLRLDHARRTPFATSATPPRRGSPARAAAPPPARWPRLRRRRSGAGRSAALRGERMTSHAARRAAPRGPTAEPRQVGVRCSPASNVAQGAAAPRVVVDSSARHGKAFTAARAVHGFTQASVQCRSLVVRTASAGMPSGATIARTSSAVSAARSDASKSARCRSCIARTSGGAAGTGRVRLHELRDARRRRGPLEVADEERPPATARGATPPPASPPGSGMWCTMLFDITTSNVPSAHGVAFASTRATRMRPRQPRARHVALGERQHVAARSIASTSTRGSRRHSSIGMSAVPVPDVEHARRPHAASPEGRRRSAR